MKHTNIPILKPHLFPLQNPPHNRHKPLIKLPRTLLHLLKLPTPKIPIRTNLRPQAPTRILQPSLILTPTPHLYRIHRHNLITPQRRLNPTPIRQNQRTLFAPNRRIQALQKRRRRDLQHVVDGRGDGELLQAHDVRVEAADLVGRGGREVARAVVLAGAVHLVVAEGGEVGGWEGLGGAVAVAVEYVGA